MSGPAHDDVVLEARGISKSFPGVRALQDVDLVLRRGKLTALLGENGAGKSTLMSIVAGVYPPDAGQLFLDGKPVQFKGPRDAQAHGIAMIYQELNLIPHLSVAENVFLGREPLTRLGLLDHARLNRDAAALLEKLELPVGPTVIVSTLRVGQQQVVEIAKALAGDARVMIMDEPTAALTDAEVDALFRMINVLKHKGVAIAYITHRFPELLHIGDDAVVLRDGKVIGAAPLAAMSHDEIVRMMVGRDLAAVSRESTRALGDELLRVEDVSLRHRERPGEYRVDHVSLRVRAGEVVGVFGLMGAGRTEFLEALFGLHPADATGDVYVAGRKVAIRSPSEAIAAGLALAPEDRKREGVVPEMSVGENASLASLSRASTLGLIRPGAERTLVERATHRFRVKTPSLRQKIRYLSGGNQQKVILAKWFATNPKVLLLDEPTRGIDVGAKAEIYALLDELKRNGLGVVAVSSDLPEVLAISDRVVVMSEGRKTAEFARGEATQEKVMRAALPQKSAAPGRQP